MCQNNTDSLPRCVCISACATPASAAFRSDCPLEQTSWPKQPSLHRDSVRRGRREAVHPVCGRGRRGHFAMVGPPSVCPDGVRCTCAPARIEARLLAKTQAYNRLGPVQVPFFSIKRKRRNVKLQFPKLDRSAIYYSVSFVFISLPVSFFGGGTFYIHFHPVLSIS